MKLEFEDGFFPFNVPELDATMAASVGPGTTYPVGLSLGVASQVYWRAKHWGITATGAGAYAYMTQAPSATGNLPERNMQVDGPYLYAAADGFAPLGIGSLVVAMGTSGGVPGSGTIGYNDGTESGTASATLQLGVQVFYPPDPALAPMVKYGGWWWPALSAFCAVDNVVTSVTSAPSLHFGGTTLASADMPTTFGTFTFFGTAVPFYCEALGTAVPQYPAETRSFTGALTVAEEWG